MTCGIIDSYDEFNLRIAQKALERRVPVFGTLELTYRCNLDCVHCYIPDHAGRGELSTEEIKRIIDEVVEEGCLFLLFTGGEIFVRRDFAELYLYAKRKGIIIYLFSNGVELPDHVLELFKSYKPKLIDLSLYGASDTTYRQTTGRDVFDRVMKNIDALRTIGLHVRVKATLLKTNMADYSGMLDLFRKWNLDVRLNSVMSYRYDGSTEPGDHRLSPDDIVRLERECEPVAAQWRRSFEIRSAVKDKCDGALYSCGAGLNSFSVTPEGLLRICATDQKHAVDLRQVSFKEAWKQLGDIIAPLKLNEDHVCRDCDLSSICLQCPAWANLDLGDEQAIVPYLCRLTHLRAAAFAGARGEGIDQQPPPAESAEPSPGPAGA